MVEQQNGKISKVILLPTPLVKLMSQMVNIGLFSHRDEIISAAIQVQLQKEQHTELTNLTHFNQLIMRCIHLEHGGL